MSSRVDDDMIERAIPRSGHASRLGVAAVLTTLRDEINHGGFYTLRDEPSTWRAVTAKLGEMPSILDYIPSDQHEELRHGVSKLDVSPIVQSTLSSNQSLRWPKGRYVIGTPILGLPSGTTWHFDPGATLYVPPYFASDTLLNAVNVSNLTFHGMCIEVDKECLASICGASFGPECREVQLVNCSWFGFNKPKSICARYLSVSDVEIYGAILDDFTDGMIFYQSCSRFCVQNSTFRRGSGNGIRVSATGLNFSSDFSIERNRFFDWLGNQSPIYITCNKSGQRHRRLTVTGNSIRGRNLSFSSGGNADLISTYEIADFAVTENCCIDGGDLGIAIEVADDGVVVGNICRRNNFNGIGLARARRVAVIGNICTGNGLDRDSEVDRSRNPIAGLYIYGGCTDLELSGNVAASSSSGAGQMYGLSVTVEKGQNTAIRAGPNNFRDNSRNDYFCEVGGLRGDLEGVESPEGRLAAEIGSMYRRRDGSLGEVLYVKERPDGARGWTAK